MTINKYIKQVKFPLKLWCSSFSTYTAPNFNFLAVASKKKERKKKHPTVCLGVCVCFPDVLSVEGVAVHPSWAGHGAAGLQLSRPHGQTLCCALPRQIPDWWQTVSVPDPTCAGGFNTVPGADCVKCVKGAVEDLPVLGCQSLSAREQLLFGLSLRAEDFAVCDVGWCWVYRDCKALRQSVKWLIWTSSQPLLTLSLSPLVLGIKIWAVSWQSPGTLPPQKGPDQSKDRTFLLLASQVSHHTLLFL